MCIHQYPLEKIFLVSAWLEAMLYGMFFCGFWLSVYIKIAAAVRNGRSRAAHNPVMSAGSVLMFVVATLNVGEESLAPTKIDPRRTLQP
ncbi:hypothetical protein MSAN_01317500 [Mycena sanguinolenta]|uniref:Uncharacterized protein n=1 Tax=Mycena sanguinolenta TaxID=230812 RepID=A0A8H6YEH8_9AGAR|nr:hypothetical protein MSAN_01317500 [Mycena sanguinolenta]